MWKRPGERFDLPVRRRSLVSERLPGYAAVTPDTLQRRFLETPGQITTTTTTTTTTTDTITVRLNRRAYSPVLRQADLPDTPAPWWGNRTLHYEFA